METKSHIRKKALALRDKMPAEERKRKSRDIMGRVMESPWYREADTLLAYIPYRSEVDTESLIRKAFQEGKKVYCPKVEGEEMNFYQIFSFGDLEKGYRGIQEPPGERDRLFSGECVAGGKCLMIMPGSAYDKERNRIGYGKGYYDKYLGRKIGVNTEIRTVGVCFSCQVQERIPADIYDRKPDGVVTETIMISGGAGNGCAAFHKPEAHKNNAEWS